MPSPRLTSPLARDHAFLLALTIGTWLVHGYHPFAEDGGLYVAGIEYLLNPALFPHDTAFITPHLSYSIFAPLTAAVVRVMAVTLPWMLLLENFLGIWLTFFSAHRIAEACFSSSMERRCAVALLAAWFTLPIAGTSLLLMDPYVTARTFSTPLTLLAVGCALRSDGRGASLLRAAVWLLAAALFHPLMAAYAAAFVLCIFIAGRPAQRTRIIAWLLLAALAITLAAVLQCIAAPENSATIAAAASRYYWFLSEWQWFECLGLAAPLLIFLLILRSRPTSTAPALLSRAAIAVGFLAITAALLFAHEHTSVHIVARLQPLRVFSILYAVMIVLCGGVAARAMQRRSAPYAAGICVVVLFLLAAIMFWTQRQTFPASAHLETPWRQPANPWSRAFLWSHDHTPTTALFAMDAHYITSSGEDAQVFRAIAQRSILADFSKDGGEAAITPSLAPRWATESAAQTGLAISTDAERAIRLAPFPVDFVVLPSGSPTRLLCPYDSGGVKVCATAPPLPPPAQP